MKISERNKINIAKLHPLYQPIAWEFLKQCQENNLLVLIYSTLRTFEEQQELYNKGRDENGNKIGKTVTNAKPGSSWHNYGLAFDCVVVQNGKSDWSIETYKKIGKVGQSLGLIWGAHTKHGGDYKTMNDAPHFEYHPQLTITEVKKRYHAGEDILKHLIPQPKEDILEKSESPTQIKDNVMQVQFRKKNWIQQVIDIIVKLIS